MEKLTNKTLVAAMAAALLLGAGGGAYFAHGYLGERREQEAQTEFTRLLGQTWQLQWSPAGRAAEAPAGKAEALIWSRSFDDSHGMAAALADLLAESTLKDDPEALAAASRLEFQLADIAYRFTRGTHASLTGSAGAPETAPAELLRSVQRAQSTIALLGNKLSGAGTSDASGVPDEQTIQLIEFLGDIKEAVNGYAASAAEFDTAAWTSGFVESARLSPEQREMQGRMAQASAALQRVDEAVRQELAVARQEQLPAPGLYRQHGLRLQVLASAYAAALVPHALDKEVRQHVVRIQWDTTGQLQRLAALPEPGGHARYASAGNDALAAAANGVCEAAFAATDAREGTASQQQLAALMGGGPGLILMRGGDDEQAPDARPGQARQFTNLLDYFWQASFLSFRTTQGTQPERLRQGLHESFGPLALHDVAPSADRKAIDFKVVARDGVLELKGSVPTTPERVDADLEALRAAAPVLVFQQEGERLAIAGLALEGKQTAYVQRRIAVPVTVASSYAQQWNKGVEEKEQAARLAAEKEEKQREEDAAKAYAEREKALQQDPVYRLANAYIAQLRPLPPCVAMAQTMRNMASSQAPAHVRELQVEAMWNKIPEICVM